MMEFFCIISALVPLVQSSLSWYHRVLRERRVSKGKRNQASRKVRGTSPGTEGNLLLLILQAKWHFQKEVLVYYHLSPANHLFV